MEVEYYDDEDEAPNTTFNPVKEEQDDLYQYADEEEPEAFGEAADIAQPKERLNPQRIDRARS